MFTLAVAYRTGPRGDGTAACGRSSAFGTAASRTSRAPSATQLAYRGSLSRSRAIASHTSGSSGPCATAHPCHAARFSSSSAASSPPSGGSGHTRSSATASGLRPTPTTLSPGNRPTNSPTGEAHASAGCSNPSRTSRS